jgi:hypothetical protein
LFNSVKDSVVQSHDEFQGIISIPLKTEFHIFLLYKAAVLPSRLSIDTSLNYQLDYHYFGLAVDQRGYTLLREREIDIEKCTTGSVTVCPLKVPLYSAQVLKSEGSLSFQNPNNYHLGVG